MMEIIIDVDDAVPLFAQLMEQIKKAVLSGQIKPGEALPSIRQLANDLDLNSKTVAKAYQLLERDSVIQSKGYRGTFVHPEAKTNSQVDLTVWISEKITGTVDELRLAGVTDSEIRIAFGNVMSNRSNQGA
jgi:GntR family transcriptional regulator